MIEVDATYQNGVLRPDKPLPLPEQQRVRITVHDKPSQPSRGSTLSGERESKVSETQTWHAISLTMVAL